MLNSIDIGRIDGHQSMPALRWEECKQIAKYQKIEPPFTKDHLIILLALFAFPDETNLIDYKEVTSTALRNINILNDEKSLELWCDLLEPAEQWVYNDELHAWTHPWSTRNAWNGPKTQQIQEILSLLDIPNLSDVERK